MNITDVTNLNATNSTPDIFETAEQTTLNTAQGSSKQGGTTSENSSELEVSGVGTAILDGVKQTTPVNYQNLTVTVKFITRGNFRLGLENTPEKFRSIPGTTQRWAPRRVGNLYRTGLDRPEMGATPEERQAKLKALEMELGRTLDSEFYNELSIKLDPNKLSGNKLYLSKAFDFVVFLAMMDDNKVANGYEEYANGTKPEAEWYIENKEAEAEKLASSRSQQIKATNTFGTLSDAKKQKIAIMAGLPVLGLSPLAVENTLWEWLTIPENKKAAIHIKLFLDWVAMGDQYINISALVKNAIAFNVIRKQASGDYFYGDTLVGTTEAEIVGKLSRVTGADLRLGIESKLQAKM